MMKSASSLLTRKIRSACRGVLTPITYAQVYEKYAGSKRRTYEQAHEWILHNGSPTKRHARVRSFVKAEKSYSDPKSPRIIQARDPVYNLEIGTFLKPIEHAIYSLKGFKFFARPGMGKRGKRVEMNSVTTGESCSRGFAYTRIVAKGMNDRERAKTIRAKILQFKNCVVLSLDCTKFDAHVAHAILKRVEHAAYLSLIPDSNFASLLAQQLNNSGTTAGGVKYKSRGGRMSGDVNTACGNVFLMLCMIIAYCRDIGIVFDILDDGDDCLLFIEANDETKVRNSIESTFLEFGMELKLENRAEDFQDVVFCRSKAIYREIPGDMGVSGEWVMCRDWRHVLKQSLSSHRHYDQPTVGMGVARSVGLALCSMYAGVPVLQSFGRAIVRLTEGTMARQFDHKSGLGYRHYLETGSWMPVQSELVTISPLVRSLFERTWGLPSDEQLVLEAMFDALTKDDLHFQLDDQGEEVFLMEDGTVLDFSQGHCEPRLFNWERVNPGRRGGIIDDPSTSTAYQAN